MWGDRDPSHDGGKSDSELKLAVGIVAAVREMETPSGPAAMIEAEGGAT
jgi:hypothetical protein